MDSPRHLSFLATKSLSSLREEAECMDGVAALKKQRRYQRIDFDAMATTRIAESTTRESIHSRWSSNASTVRERFLEDRASRRASDYHAKTISPTIADSHLDKVDGRESQIHSPKPKRSSRPTDKVAPDSPPELPLLRISSFPDLVAAGLAMSSNRAPDTTPVSISDSFTVSDSSSFHGLLGFASEFPQPPSLSPALRKMQSVPWLKDDNANAGSSGQYSSWRRMSGLVTPQEPARDVDLSFPYSMDDVASIPSANSSFYLDTLMALNQQQKVLGGEVPQEGPTKAGDISWFGQDAYKSRTIDDLLEWSVSHQGEETQRVQPSGNDSIDDPMAQTRQRLMKRTDGRRNTVSSTLDAVVPLVADKRRTVRKVASMQASSEQPGKPFSEAATTTSSKTASGQRSIPKIRSRLFPSHSYNSSSAGGKQDNGPLALGSRSQTELGSKSRNWFFHLRNPSGKAANVKQGVSSNAVATTGARPISATAAAASPSSKDDSERRNFRNTLRQQHQRTPYPTQGGPPPTLASANDKRTSKIYRRSRYRDSEPHISGLGLGDIDSEFVAAAASQSSVGLCLDLYGSAVQVAQGTGGGSGSGQSRPLDGPFTLKKSQANEYVRASSNRRSLERQDTSVETSFMDITPERKKVTSTELKPGDEAAAVERKDRVRKFIAKASSGFLEWSRGLTSAKRS
ncbi:hypothetical protein H1R20_g5609, partial [Candolleomyces eurysporus]